MKLHVYRLCVVPFYSRANLVAQLGFNEKVKSAVTNECCLTCKWKTIPHRNTCSSGNDHDQISSWILGSHYSELNDLSILRCGKEKRLNELSIKSFKIFLCNVELHKYIFMDESNDETSSWTSREMSSVWQTSHWKNTRILLSCYSTTY